MAKAGPIILVDDDKDDCDITVEAINQLEIPNEVKCFHNGKDAFDYLETTREQPFIILSDINMPMVNGLELREMIESNRRLKEKSIPFIFMSTTPAPAAVKEAYRLSVQGFFTKETSLANIKTLLQQVFTYWQRCKHPNQ